MNPDGVSRGNWRFDTNGMNLNRFWTNPCPEKHPAIKAVKDAIIDEHHRGRLMMYVDFHAHMSKRGCFVFGNSVEDIDMQVEAKLIPKLMALNSVNFDFRISSF